jgi:hypothetical protein
MCMTIDRNIAVTAPCTMSIQEDRRIQEDSYKGTDAFMPLRVESSVNSTSCHHFQSELITIDAPIEKVWEIVKHPENYAALSNGAIHAEIKGDLAVGSTILLKVCPDSFAGKIMGESEETITMVDEKTKTIGWSRPVPLCGTTARYHALKWLGPNTTSSQITLDVPGAAGVVCSALFRKTIEPAFNALNQGIAREAMK